jgi:hypothetical protein
MVRRPGVEAKRAVADDDEGDDGAGATGRRGG